MHRDIDGFPKRRHIIIEGMDGSGKDTLIDRLQALPFAPFGQEYQLHPRASTSLGGPIDNLSDWVEHTNYRLPTTGPWMFNRHPLISELIYAPYRDINRGLSGKFTDKAWVANQQRILADHAVVVFVQPKYSAVETALRPLHWLRHMPGVWSNRQTLYNLYRNFMWPGVSIRWDREYTSVIDLAISLDRLLEK